MFEFPVAAVIYCFLVGTGFLSLWLWYERRDYRRFETGGRKSAFHCIRCETLYSAASRTQPVPCPKCGHENARLRF